MLPSTNYLFGDNEEAFLVFDPLGPRDEGSTSNQIHHALEALLRQVPPALQG